MIDGKVKGYFLLGQNPAVGSAHGRLQRLGMAQLDWLVVRDLFEIESASFWKDSPEIETGEIVPEECGTEVFLLPAASHVEKEGTFTQTQRSEEHTSELQSLMRISYAVFCLKQKKSQHHAKLEHARLREHT